VIRENPRREQPGHAAANDDRTTGLLMLHCAAPSVN
jgi:hypothetical protein